MLMSICSIFRFTLMNIYSIFGFTLLEIVLLIFSYVYFDEHIYMFVIYLGVKFLDQACLRLTLIETKELFIQDKPFTAIPVTSYSSQHLVLQVAFIVGILVNVKRYLIVIFLYLSVKTGFKNTLTCWPFVVHILKSTCASLLHICMLSLNIILSY